MHKIEIIDTQALRKLKYTNWDNKKDIIQNE